VGWIDSELVLVALAAMVSPTTLTFSILTLVLGDRPLRTGFWFYIGAMGATLAVGVVAAFALKDVAASSHPSTPKTWVAILDVVFALFLIGWAVRSLRRPQDPEATAKMVDQIRKVATAPILAIVGAGAALANPGGFIPIALKTISELNPSSAQYVADWVFFAVVSLLPLALALILLLIAREPTERRLSAIREWLEARFTKIFAIIVLLLAAALLRNGIAGLVHS
jgi:hypothetical protein